MRNKISNAVWKCFLAFFACILLTTLILCVLKTNDLVPIKDMATKPFLFIGFAILLSGLCIVYERFFAKLNRFMLPLFMVVYGVGLFLVSVSSKASPVHDAASVYEGALYMAGLSDEMSWTYFARCSNNTMPMIFMSFILRAGKLLGFENVYYCHVITNVIQVLLALYCVYRIGGRFSTKHTLAASWCGMGMLAVYFPIIAHTQSVYTDAFSFSFGIVAFYVWMRNREINTGKKRYWIGLILAGLIWAIGVQIKATVLISLIAVTAYIVLYDGWKKLLEHMVIWGLVIAVALGCSAYKKSLPSMEHYHTWGFPTTTYFIALGLEGDGGFNLGSEYFNTVMNIYGMEEKKAYTNQYIIDNISNFWDKEHMLAKLRNNFAAGRMKGEDFYQICENQNFIYQCVSYSGNRFTQYTMWITAYWYAILALCIVTCALKLLLERNKQEKVFCFVPILSFFGVMCYVMLSEANNRQLYNHLPWIFLSANMSIWMLHDLGLRYKIKKSQG